MSLKLIYVAGPFSAPTREGVEANIRKATALAVEVAKLGAFPVTPHANTAHPDFERVQPYQFWIAGTMALLHMCRGIITTEDWEQSSGARGEVREALRTGRPWFRTLADLAIFLEATKDEQEF